MKLAILTTCLSLAAPAASADALWEWEIEAAFIDRAFTFEWVDGADKTIGILIFREDGRVQTRGSDGYQPVGYWRLRGSKLCVGTDQIRNGQEICAKVTVEGDKYVTARGLELLPSSDVGFLSQ